MIEKKIAGKKHPINPFNILGLDPDEIILDIVTIETFCEMGKTDIEISGIINCVPKKKCPYGDYIGESKEGIISYSCKMLNELYKVTYEKELCKKLEEEQQKGCFERWIRYARNLVMDELNKLFDRGYKYKL